MKSYIFLLVCILGLTTSCNSEKKVELPLETQELPLHNKRVLILGNSITENGKYVDFIEYYLRKQYPKVSLDIISIGLSAETISGTSEDGRDFSRPNISERLENALEKTNPDVVLACYGMNDGNYNPLDSLRFKAYKNGILKLKSKVEALNAQLILLTPTIFDPDPIGDRLTKEGEIHNYSRPYYKYNDVLTAYSNWLLSIKTDELKVIDLHHHLNPILANMKRITSDSSFTFDGIHPTKIGHFYMAQKILKDLYPEVPLENPVSEIERLEVDSLYHLVSKRRELRSEGWRNYVGYTNYGKTVKSDDISATKTEVKKLDLAINKQLNP